MSQTFLSPGVDVTETDNTLTTPQQATNIGYGVLPASWGPVSLPQLIDSEMTLVNVFGRPNDNNYKHWMNCANFLAYTNALYVTRLATKNQFTANGAGLTGWKQMIDQDHDDTPIVDENGEPVMEQIGLVINNQSDYDGQIENLPPKFGQFCAKYPGELGNSIMVTYADSASFDDWKWTDDNGIEHNWTLEFSEKPSTSNFAAQREGSNDEMHLLVIDAGGRITGTKGTILEKFEFVSKGSNSRNADGINNFYKNAVNQQSQYVYWLSFPGEDLVGQYWSQSVDKVFEKTAELTAFVEGEEAKVGFRAFDKEAKKIHTIISTKKVVEGVFKTVVELDGGLDVSGWNQVRMLEKMTKKVFTVSIEDGQLTLAPSKATDGKFGDQVDQTQFGNLYAPVVERLSGGSNDFDYTDGDEIAAYELVKDKERYDIGLIITANASQHVAKHVIENICEVRQDCVAFCSPSEARGPILGSLTSSDRLQGITSSDIKVLNKTLAWRTDASFNVSSSYGHLDSGWKYQYDKYNDIYRWVPLNGDIGGVYARTDATNAPWWSGAGYNRGQIKNVVKLSFNPNKTMRDQLYQQGINSVVTFVGEGTILYGDKTLLAKPSAFDRINVRRLFIFLEKTLSRAAKYLLFEFNNQTTRNYAIALCEPILKQVQGQQGINKYLVICDSSNNGPEIVDANRFCIDIMVAPGRSINFISLNFIAEKTGSSVFSEQG